MVKQERRLPVVDADAPAITSSPYASRIEVAVPLPLFTTFTYAVPRELSTSLSIGMRVLAPFGKRVLTGYVVGFPQEEPEQKLKEIRDVLDAEPLFCEDDLQFYQWVAAYYHYPLGQTIKTALPRGINIEYANVAVITDQGKKALGAVQTDFPGKALLRELATGGGVSLKSLYAKVEKQGFSHLIRLLNRKGFIELFLKKRGGSVGIRKEKWFSVVPAHTRQKLTEKEKKIVACIAHHGTVPYCLLTAQFGSCSRQVQALGKKGFVAVEEREQYRRPAVYDQVFSEPVREPTEDQKKIIRRLEQGIEKKIFSPMLLHGVTGSGKTEIYLTAMQQVLQSGRQCLYLVPEIALTAQLYDRIRSRLNAPLAMLHSSLTDAERFDAWRMIRRGDVRIVLGARSAVFASFQDLGVIVVDEEHDPSYKQDEQLRYNARDIALVKARLSGCTVILGSATPSLESYYNALQKKYDLGVLPRRVENRSLPRVTIVDMRNKQAAGNRKSGIISQELRHALARTLSEGMQSLLFLNRRGFSPAFLCQQCGHTFTCPNCAVSLINHKGEKKLCCHYCDYALPVPVECPSCRSYFLAPLGWGTERIEAEIKALFPDARVARMDRDTTARSGDSRALLHDMHRRSIDILIGTQMIVKGYHLPHVTLVGVISADQSLNLPDYRAGERTFQLITQVAGRAGRGDAAGEVLIQTYNPDHYSIVCAQEHDYRQLYETEMKNRKELQYPPYTKMINIRFEGAHRVKVQACAQMIGDIGRALLDRSGDRGTVEVLGPARAPWEKIKGRYRYQMLLKGKNMQRLRFFAAHIIEQGKSYIHQSNTRVCIDVDPLMLM